MQIKIAGIGKCGIRIAYDLFAYSKGLPSAYQIRLDVPQSKVNDALASLGLPRDDVRKKLSLLRASMRNLIGEFNGLYRIAEGPIYVTIDSDSANNEIVNGMYFSETVEGKRTNAYQFPGVNYDLNGHKGGCNFHVVSESLARTWQQIQPAITDIGGVDIYVTSFSIAGGTGGGSAPIICKHSRDKAPRERPGRDRVSRDSAGSYPGLCHYMGLGILPKSDEVYVETDDVLSMSDYEKFSTGRFLASIYGNRVPDSMNSLWLYSNDVLRFLVSDRVEESALETAGGELNLNLSMVNFFVAQSLTVLANSSSKLASADTNLDPRELNDYLEGKPFISGMSRQNVGDVSSVDVQVLAVKRLLCGALTNIKEQSGRLEGLSVPVLENDLQELRDLLDESVSNRNEFVRAMSAYDADLGPIEFQTTARLIILYGQPQAKVSEIKKDLIMRASEKIFPNAQKHDFMFQHHASTETLLLLLVDPFIPPVVSAIYYYANNAWSASGHNLRDRLDAIIGEGTFVEPDFFEKEELFPESMYGGGAEDVKERVEADKGLKVGHVHIMEAFRHLHKVYHRERPSTSTSSGLHRKKSQKSTSSAGAKKNRRDSRRRDQEGKMPAGAVSNGRVQDQ